MPIDLPYLLTFPELDFATGASDSNRFAVFVPIPELCFATGATDSNRFAVCLTCIRPLGG